MPRQRFQDPQIQQSKNGCYFIRPWVDIVTKDGLQRKKKTIVLGTPQLGKRGAIAKKNDVMRTINNADYVIKSQITFKEFVDKYRTDHLALLGHAQYCKFDWAYKKHLAPSFDKLTLSEVTPHLLQQWFNAKQSLSMETRKGLRNIISGIFERAIYWKLYNSPVNPVKGLFLGGNEGAREKKKLTGEQTRQFLADQPYDVRMLCCVSLFCTLRVSEALALQERHLDFDNGEILIRQSFYRGVLRKMPKSAKGRREIPMGYLKDDLRHMCSGDPEAYVFRIRTAPKWGREVGYCRDDRDLNQHFLRPSAKKLKFYYPGFGFRALRREAITSIGSIAGIGEAMNAAGHAQVDTTLLYTLDDMAARKRAIEQHQEKILGKPVGGIQ